MAEKVIWSAAAREEDYCLQLIEFAETAGDFPRLGRTMPELENENVREIIRSPYRIIYELSPNQSRPVILRIWHGARGTPEISPPTSL